MAPNQLNAFLDAIPETLREQVLDGRRERRGGKLPLRLVLQLVVAMAFRPDRSIPAVLEELVEIVGRPATWHGKPPEPSSITAARDRLGWETLRELYRSHVEATEAVFGQHRWRGLRVAGLDGTTLHAPDTPLNEAAFTRPGGRQPAGFPTLRLLALVDVFSHQVRAASFGPYKGPGSGELSLAKQYLVDQLPAETLLLMDRGFQSYGWLRMLQEREIPFVVRLKTGKNTVKPKLRESLERGCDRLIDFPVPKSFRPRAGAEELPLRWIKCTLPKQRSKRKKKKKGKRGKLRTDTRRRGRKRSRHIYLLTNLVDPEAFPWKEIASLYLSRWEVEFAFREIKSSLTNRKVEFRSKKPERVLQEAYALLLAYNSIRLRMAEAVKGKRDPTELSFTDCMHAIRRAYCTGEAVPLLLPKLARLRIPKRERRWYPRVVKMRASPYPTKSAANAA